MNWQRAAALMAHDPGAFARKVVARASGVLGMPSGVVVRRIGDVRFSCDLALDPRVRDMYFGVYEPREVAFLRATLVRGDTFVDAGANIGYFSAVAAACVSPEGEVHAFEPVPEYHTRLAALRDANPRHRIRAENVALGAAEGTAEIRVSRAGNIGWNTVVPGFMAASASQAVVTVPMRRLDDALERAGVERVALIKLDAEGYELPVLEGARRVLADASGRRRPVVLCEVAPAAYPLLGRSLDELFELMTAHGYCAEDLDGRRVTSGALRETTNVVFRPAA